MRSTRSAGFEPNATPAALADGTFIDEFNAGGFECGDEFHQGIDVAADYTFACLHALDRRKREPRGRCQVLLVHPNKCARRAKLSSGDQCYSLNNNVLTIIV
jgi:hypothetical protein